MTLYMGTNRRGRAAAGGRYDNGFSQERGGRLPELESGVGRRAAVAGGGCASRLRVRYFTAEKLVGCRNELTTLATIGPFFSVSARA